MAPSLFRVLQKKCWENGYIFRGSNSLIFSFGSLLNEINSERKKNAPILIRASTSREANGELQKLFLTVKWRGKRHAGIPSHLTTPYFFFLFIYFLLMFNICTRRFNFPNSLPWEPVE